MALPHVSFTHPAYLLLLPVLLAGVWWLSRRSLAGLPAGRARLSLVLRCVLVSALVLALAGLQVSRPTNRLAVLFLLDRSHSIPEDLRQRALDFVNEAAERLGRNDRAGVIVFGSEAHLEVEPSRALRLGQIASVPGREYTDLAAAVRLALAAFPADAQRRIVLVTDGNENLGSALQEALAVRAAGIQIDVVPIRYEYEHEVLVERIHAPAEVRIGEPFELRAVVTATYEGEALLRLLRDRHPVEARRVRLQPGKNLVRFEQSLAEAKPHSFEIVLEADPDELPENNRALALTLVRGEPRVLLVDSDREDAEFLARALRGRDITVDVRLPGQLPATLAEFQAYDSIILSNVGADQLTPDQMRMIRSNVRDLGAGLVMIGGERSFGPGAWRGTPVEEALPVTMDVSKDRTVPKGAVAMVLHSCEFPDGNRWAAQTAASVVDSLGDEDEVGILVYEWQAREQWGLPMQPARDKDALKSQIFRLDPGDMPDFHRILAMAREELSKSNAAVKHIIIITDGDPQPPSDELVQNLIADQISVSAVVIHPHPGIGVGATPSIAQRTGGRFYLVEYPEDIPQIFLKEAQRVLKPAVIEEPFNPLVQEGAPLLRGLPPPPPLRGYVATSAKEAASVDLLMASERGDPLLVTWRYGLGKSVAFTSDAKNRWAAPWVAGWGGNFNQFWAQVVRWTIRSADKANFETSVEISERRGRVVIDALDEEGDFLNFLDVRGSVASERRSLDLRLEQTAPGRYEGEFDAPDTGQYIVSVSYEDPDGTQRLHTVGAAVPYSPEYAHLEADEAVLTGLAERTGGRLYPGLGDPDLRHVALPELYRREGRTRSAPTDAWPLLMLLAALLLPLDIAVRRVMIPLREAWVPVKAALGRLGLLPPEATPAPTGGAPLDRLRHAKDRAHAPGGEPEKKSPAAAPARSPSTPTVAWTKPPPGAAPAPPPEPEAPSEPAAAPPPEAHTSRLLRAKRRARGEEE